jgi:hypothetical protein
MLLTSSFVVGRVILIEMICLLVFALVVVELETIISFERVWGY